MIDQSGRDWAALLAGWADALPTSFTAWLVNRFGDVIAVLDDGSVHLLDIGVGTFERVAQNRAHFAELVDEGGNVNKWLMIPLVDQCLAAGLVLRPNQCYGYKLPPLLGVNIRCRTSRQ